MLLEGQDVPGRLVARGLYTHKLRHRLSSNVCDCGVSRAFGFSFCLHTLLPSARGPTGAIHYQGTVLAANASWWGPRHAYHRRTDTEGNARFCALRLHPDLGPAEARVDRISLDPFPWDRDKIILSLFLIKPPLQMDRM